MKKILSVTMTIMILLGCMNLTVFAEDETLSANVFVTIADKGSLAVAQEEVYVTDIDADNKLTINDALYATHEAKYDGGASAGYATAVTDWGLGIAKLWGDKSGNFGYYVNNASAWSLVDEVKDGDYLNAFIYADGEYYSDTYCYFDINSVKADAGKNITLTLSGAGYDAEWNPIVVPVAGATITVDGVKTSVKTDENGATTIQIADGGNHVISAVSDTQTLVPPVCLATVSSKETANVYVTISDKDGKLALVQEKITVSDVDKDGYLTINDALYNAHEAKYEGGATAGYASSSGSYGLSLNKLWGTANGGSYGYYVNNASAWSLADVVKEGDYINAFVYTDLTAWSDTYCYFDAYTTASTAGKEVTLTLSMYQYDADWNKVAVPVEGATITIDGEKTEVKTDKEGKATITISTEGTYLISAVSDKLTLVPPVCTATVSSASQANTSGASPKTGDTANMYLLVACMMISFGGIIVLNDRRKKSYEK